MKKLIILGSVAVLLPMVSFAAYVGAGDSVTAPVATESSQNSYLVGGTVNVANQTPGDLVTAGDALSVVGDSGELYTSGPHLHFEIWYKGSPLDPEKHILF